MPAQREDLPHASGDMGTMAFAVRSDTAAALGGTDGDYQPLITDASGRLHVLDQNSAAMAADVAETNLFTSAGKTIIANMEFLALSNTQGTTVVHANTVGSRFALMGLQGATNTTGGYCDGSRGGRRYCANRPDSHGYQHNYQRLFDNRIPLHDVC